jgi:hypothetical protein
VTVTVLFTDLVDSTTCTAPNCAHDAPHPATTKGIESL